ncbi:hypothetical protein RSOL_412810 [Rhizoctonia solani AG-3 Rhs1AP]|uniref:DUF6589 domain-containing protein n=1 Tax=Rhizoctonia solani AG-3 Rhs1AP TaxID=1086054 RepID=X8JDJ5_9AGAM|nr:hypothetical protein RSOL_412810 [Rhizoctonia solani AG-3 Rhs1AP]
MSKKRRIGDVEEEENDHSPNLAPYQFAFRVTMPNTPSSSTNYASLSSSNVFVAPSPQSSQTSARPAKKARKTTASAQQSETTVRSYNRRADKTAAIMKLLTEDRHYHLGDFLQDIFDPSKNEQLSNTAQSAVGFWLKGSSREGTRPAEIVDAIYRHPAGLDRDGSIVRRANFLDLTPPAKPPTFASTHPSETSLLPSRSGSESLKAEQVNSRQGLEELMVRGTLQLVDREANILTSSENGLKRSAGMSWDELENISRDEQEQQIRTSGPVIWAILSTIAFSRTRNSDPAQSSGIRDAALATIMAILMLLSFRNPLVNFFQAVLTLFLFSCNTGKLVYQALNRMGQIATDELATLAKRAYECAAGLREGSNYYFMLVFDNVNKFHLARKQTVGSKSRMKNGTAATAIRLEDVPLGAFDPRPYWEQIKSQARNALNIDTLLDDIDPICLENAGAGLVMRTLLLYIPSLPQRLRQEVEARFRSLDGYAIHRLRLRKSVTLSMGTSNINESTADGVSKILHDLVTTQMKMLASWFNKILILVGGDQLTIDRLRKVRYFRAIENNIYESRSWAIPLIQLWHMKVAYLRSIFKIHWFDKTSSNLFGLRQSMQAIGRNNSTEFYPCHYAVKTVFEGMVLTATYTLLQQNAGLDPEPTDSMLLELGKHFAVGSRYHDCSLSDFEQLARGVYRRYMTTEGFHKTLKCTGPGPLTSKDWVKATIFQKFNCYEQDSNYTANTSTGPERSSSGDDQLLGNMVLFMRDAFIYLEMASAIPEGDIGRVYEVTKLLRFFFWGSNATNYGNELLEMACGFLYEYPEKLRTAILNNWLVNPSGLAGHWQECDFFQEHCNKAIKTVFNTKNSEWDSQFLRNSVSVNITHLTQLRDTVLKFLGVGSVGSGRSRPNYSADINVLASHYLRENVFTFRPGRSQEVVATDMFHEGLNKLSGGALSQFLERTQWDIEDINPEFSQPLSEAADEEAPMNIPEQALVVEEGALLEEEIQLE